MSNDAVMQYTLNVDAVGQYAYYDIDDGKKITDIVVKNHDTDIKITLNSATQALYKITGYDLVPESAKEQLNGAPIITDTEITLSDQNTISGQADLVVVVQSLADPSHTVRCDPQVHNDPPD